jgi:hypothetical protein
VAEGLGLAVLAEGDVASLVEHALAAGKKRTLVSAR